MTQWLACARSPSKETHVEPSVGNEVAAHVAFAALGVHHVAHLSLVGAVVVGAAEALNMQAVAGVLAALVVHDGVVGLGILRTDGLPGVPGTSRLLAQHFHQLVVLAVVVVPGDSGLSVAVVNLEVAEAALHGWQVGNLLVGTVVAHAREHVGIVLAGLREAAVLVELALRLAVPVEVAFHVAIRVQLVAYLLHAPGYVAVGLAALEGSVMVPGGSPYPLRNPDGALILALHGS